MDWEDWEGLSPKERRVKAFVMEMRETVPELMVIHENCPSCRSSELEYGVKENEWHCWCCGIKWRGVIPNA